MPNLYFSPTASAHRMPAAAPRTIDPTGLSEPHAGVMATRPATTPDAAPMPVPLPCRIRSTRSQPSIAAAVATVVLTQTRPVSPTKFVAKSTLFWKKSASSPATPCVATGTIEPTLKPNQPNHSRPAPSIVNGTLCGRSGSLPNPRGCR